MHTIANTAVDFVGPDAARVETYVYAQHRCRDAEGPFIEYVGGRYIDRFERRDGAWKIADRVCVREWDKRERVTPAFAPGRFSEGRRDHTDLCYGTPA
jgi:hypothetical protein